MANWFIQPDSVQFQLRSSLWLLLLLLLASCSPVAAPEGAPPAADTYTQSTYVIATIDGRRIQTPGWAVYRQEQAGDVLSGSLQLFPAQTIAGNISWLLGDTGIYTLAGAAGSDALLTYTDHQNRTYVATDGVLAIQSWTPLPSSDPYDSRVGYISGTFEGTFVDLDGVNSVRITGGAFRAAVQQHKSAGG